MSEVVGLVRNQSEFCIERVTSNNTFAQPRTSLFNQAFGLTWAIFLWTYKIFFLTWYIIRRRNSYYLQKRQLAFIVLPTLHMMYENTWALREFVGRHNYPCVLSQPAILLAFLLLGVPILLRASSYYAKIEFTKLAAKDRFLSELKESYHAGLYNIITRSVRFKSSKKKSSEGRRKQSFFSVLSDPLRQSTLLSSTQIAEESADLTPGRRPVMSKTMRRKEKNRLRKVKIFKVLQSDWFLWVVYFFAAIIFLFTIFEATKEVIYCFGCENEETKNLEFVVTGFVFFLCVVGINSVFYLIRKEPDPLLIKRELTLIAVTPVLGVLFWLIFEIADVGNLNEDGRIYWGYFLQIAFAMMFFIMVPLQIKNSYEKDNTENNRRLSLHPNAMENLEQDFRKDMEIDSIRQQFKGYLVTEQALENFYFYAEVSNWKEDFEASTEAERRSGFKFIYSVFVGKSTILMINIGSYLREDLKDVSLKLDDADFAIDKSVFDEALNEVKLILLLGPYQRFKEQETDAVAV